ncbi:MAG: hypothetical protein JXP34_04575 [Planctomycetes bacterium]|nr:hypothetical protein [Planctomycetota bacterium]
MASMIQIRNVPEKLHRKLKARAALAGMSLSDYLLREIRIVAEQPTREEILERLSHLSPTTPRTPVAEAVRAERDAR